MSETSSVTELPDVGTWQTGQLDIGSRCFDLLCFGKCDLDEKEQKLIVAPADKIPNLMTINKDGKIVFAEPKPMCTVRVPKGHTGWIYIELVKVSPQTTNCENYLCLGIHRRGENKIIGPLYSVTDYTSKYVGLADDEVMELVPMLSKTKLSEGYTEVKAGEEVNVTGLTIPTDGVFDFGSVYRINMKYHGDILWIMRDCDLGSGSWKNYGYVARGLVHDKENQMLVINWENGQLKSSSDGMHWEDAGSVYNTGEKVESVWDVAPKYGNGTWCVPNYAGTIKYSTDGAKTWKIACVLPGSGFYVFAFNDGKFMCITSDRKVFTSTDAINWNQKNITLGSVMARILEYGNGKWICADDSNDLFCSKNGEEWSPMESNLISLVTFNHRVCGGEYANGNFYIIDNNDVKMPIFRSQDGKNWYKIVELNDSLSPNISYLDNNKLFVFSSTHCHFGLFYPNDMYDSL